jgi:hypothetical protein
LHMFGIEGTSTGFELLLTKEPKPPKSRHERKLNERH